jgi:acetyl-CoA carboxylase biotin carboxyl carrier protein
MTIDDIKELIRVVQDTGIAELEVQRGDNKVRIRNAGSSSQDVVLPGAVPFQTNAPQSASPSLTAPEPRQPASAISSGPREEDRDSVVKSPIVGTYYDAPSPGSAPFVKVGDQVHPKQVICIIESMKLMNEIEAELSGIVVAKLVENGRPVEYGESLLTIRPL